MTDSSLRSLRPTLDALGYDRLDPLAKLLLDLDDHLDANRVLKMVYIDLARFRSTGKFFPVGARA